MKSLIALLIVASTLLGACSGEGRPFEEAVEVAQTGLVGLSISKPATAIEPLFIASNQRVELQLSGRDADGNTLVIDKSDRAWRVSDSTVASVSDSGLVTGLRDGTVDVTVQIADIESPPYRLSVSNASLASIASIQGNEAVDPCRSASYSATGLYADGTERALPVVEWSIADQEARLLNATDGSVSLTAVAPGVVELTASSAGLALTRTLSVTDSLTSIEITPVQLGLTAGGSRQLIATGAYFNAQLATPIGDVVTDNPSLESTLDITAAVDWRISSGETLATIGNTTDDKGNVTATAAGTIAVSAACGPVSSVATLSIAADSTEGSSDSDLSFDVVDDSDEVYQLPLATRVVNIRVSTGSSFSTASEVTTQTATNWSVVSGADVVTVNNIGASKGQVTAIKTGTAIVRVTYDGRFADLTINVL